MSLGRIAVASLGSTLLALMLAWGCASHAPVDPQVSADRLHALAGAAPRVDGTLSSEIPSEVRLDDGLTDDEAVALALWNNAAFQVSVSELGFARADLVEAGLLTNPVLSLLFPIGPKQLEAALRWPVEVLWQRPRRVAAAELAGEAAAERLVLAGLDLVLAVRVAYADFSLATDRQRLAEEAASTLARINTLTQSRLAVGDISELDARVAEVDSARGAQDAQRAGHDVTIARERLRLLLGLPADAVFPALAMPATPPVDCGPAEALLREALVARPDVRAAEITVEAAAARLGWEKSRVVTLTAVLDANGEGRNGFEAGPGIELGLPVFNRNQGGRTRGEAELQRAAASYVAIQQRVALELREASTQLEQARQSLTAWRQAIMTPLLANLASAQASFDAGDTSSLFVLEHSRRLADARVRERELDADQQRARARIERAVGRSCRVASQETSREH